MAKKYTYAQTVCIRMAGKCMQKTGQLWPQCRVGVAISGGVDSAVLLKVLLERQKILPFSFEIMALHLNPGFDVHVHQQLWPWLEELGVAVHLELCDFGVLAHSAENKKKSPCFRCAWLRRKRLFALCAQYGLTHLAFGHTLEDLTTSFFMNLARNGRVEGMHMREPFFSGKLQVIRPLLLVEKKYIQAAARQWKLPVFANVCPSAGNTERSAMEKRLQISFGSENMLRSIKNAVARFELEHDKITESNQ
ncbi:MAG: tRNA 2-thiocytidine biosynthesis protein TtcA [Desulfovibrio sp.]|nr:tRNA 2-thiocytidine biosynthesis protein TtcA [Desulfovibrio sp.]